jgi:hypothetical protein
MTECVNVLYLAPLLVCLIASSSLSFSRRSLEVRYQVANTVMPNEYNSSRACCPQRTYRYHPPLLDRHSPCSR